ncbi:MAG TPA: peptide-methionine (S)-S-oxide reductase MsrA [Candidatus Gracilibacteria bacterium]|nr:peptide-methionine (S)-S-oxide reductase MsrA [Candidatus Gracilibacteria bacterium]
MKSGKGSAGKLEEAILGGGCFWCLEAVYSHTKGVKEVLSGYSGGTMNDPSYEQVSGGRTGHVEVVKVVFDPVEIAYDDIIHIFFSIHDPTTLNRQGNDIGPQYRSAIFATSDEQLAKAKSIKKDLEDEKIFGGPIVTEILPLDKFFVAEKYHQQYYRNNPEQAYCQIIIAPKLAKFREKYRKFYT